MITRKPVRVTVPDRSAELPDDLPAGTRVRLTPTRTTGVVIRAEQDRGGAYIVVRLESNGGHRCIPPDRLTPVKRRRKRRAAPSATAQP